MRYTRQRQVRGVGDRGHDAIRSAFAEVRGAALDAEVCALYLAGAGVRSLRVHERIAELSRSLNSDVDVVSTQVDGNFSVSWSDASFQPVDPDPVRRGSEAARWVLAKILSDGGRDAS